MQYSFNLLLGYESSVENSWSQALLKTRIIFNKCKKKKKNQIPETPLHDTCNYFQDIYYTFDHLTI